MIKLKLEIHQIWFISTKKNGDRKNIEWIVLDTKDGKALVISKYALECKQGKYLQQDINVKCTVKTSNNFVGLILHI